MRHKNAFRKLNRSTAHRRALFRNLETSLIVHEKIQTTLPKAKELRRIVEKLVTLGKKDSLHRRRVAMKYLFAINRQAPGAQHKLTAIHRLFTELGPRYAERNGGYTRVLRSKKRDGDNAQLAVISFVEAASAEKTEKRKRRVVRKAAAGTESAKSAPAEKEAS